MEEDAKREERTGCKRMNGTEINNLKIPNKRLKKGERTEKGGEGKAEL